jgi:hypothetical protein
MSTQELSEERLREIEALHALHEQPVRATAWWPCLCPEHIAIGDLLAEVKRLRAELAKARPVPTESRLLSQDAYLTSIGGSRLLTLTLDLNEPQLDGLRRMAERYPHGWKLADITVRKDAKETRWEADWVQDVLRAVRAVTAPKPRSTP